jgi:hypothetical protein
VSYIDETSRFDFPNGTRVHDARSLVVWLLTVDAFEDRLGDIHRAGLTARKGRPPREHGPPQLRQSGAHAKYKQAVSAAGRVLPRQLRFLPEMLGRMPTRDERMSQLARMTIEGGHIHASKVAPLMTAIRRRLDSSVTLSEVEKKRLKRGLEALEPLRVDLGITVPAAGPWAVSATYAAHASMVAFPPATGYPTTLLAREVEGHLDVTWISVNGEKGP